LQDAGYATDPAYADKIGRILDSDALKNVTRLLKDATAQPITLVRAPTTN
jgi:flagellum-specific peptidoglycan hydrolase FlgJ